MPGGYKPDARISAGDVGFYGLGVGACPVFEDDGLQLEWVRVGVDNGGREDGLAGEGDHGGDGWVEEGLADHLCADEAGGASHY